MEGSSTSNFKYPTILDGTFFKVKSHNKDHVVGTCLTCNEDKHGTLPTTSNFSTHLKTHPSEHTKYITYKLDKGKRKNVEIDTARNKKTLSMANFVQRNGSTSQVQADALVLDYIVSGMRPLSTVRDPAFRRMMDEWNPNLDLMWDNKLSGRVNSESATKRKEITAALSRASHICLTADLWSKQSRAFFGMTAHIICPETLTRKSFALSCKRFVGVHSYDKIGEIILEIMKAFEVKNSNGVGIVTDNGTNFVKAFEEYSKEIPAEKTVNQDDDDGGLDCVDLTTLLNDNEESTMVLPPHFRCASHTLNLTAKSDCYKISSGASSSAYSKTEKSTMAKCQSVWNKLSYPKKGQILFDVVGKHLQSPGITRWNSKYDSIRDLLNVAPEKIDEFCTKLEIPKFKTHELEFLRFYEIVMKPVAVALDKLQGEVGKNEDAFLGSLAPAILTVVANLQSFLQSDTYKIVHPLIHGLLGQKDSQEKGKKKSGLYNRYKPIVNFDFTNERFKILVLAPLSHPFFKLRWIPPEKIEVAQNLFVEEAMKFDVPATVEVAPATTTSSTVGFYNFPSQSTFKSLRDSRSVQLECFKYLKNCNTDLSMLHNYPIIKRMFLRYNTVLPSSAPVERLFSFAGLILTPKRCHLGGKMFENLIVLKCNP